VVGNCGLGDFPRHARVLSVEAINDRRVEPEFSSVEDLPDPVSNVCIGVRDMVCYDADRPVVSLVAQWPCRQS